jgi:hypothetical protein
MKKFATLKVEHSEMTHVVVEYDDADYPVPAFGPNGLYLEKMNSHVLEFAAGVVSEKFQKYEFTDDFFRVVGVARLDDTRDEGYHNEMMPRPDGWAVERFLREFKDGVKKTPSLLKLDARNGTEVALFAQYHVHDNEGRSEPKWALIEDSIIDLRDADIGDNEEMMELVNRVAKVLDLNVEAVKTRLTTLFGWKWSSEDNDLPF